MAIDLSAIQASLVENDIPTEIKDSTKSVRPTLSSDIYKATVRDAYFITSERGSHGLTIVLQLDGVSEEYSETIYFTSTKTKGPWYVNSQGKKVGLPGFYQVNEFCQLTLDKNLGECTTVTKQAKVWENGSQVIRSVDGLDGCVGAELEVAILAVEKNRFSNGVETDEKVTVNNIDKFLSYPDKATCEEIRTSATPEFHVNWLQRNKGKVINKFKTGKDVVSAPTQSSGSSDSFKDLFKQS